MGAANLYFSTANKPYNTTVAGLVRRYRQHRPRAASVFVMSIICFLFRYTLFVPLKEEELVYF